MAKIFVVGGSGRVASELILFWFKYNGLTFVLTESILLISKQYRPILHCVNVFRLTTEAEPQYKLARNKPKNISCVGKFLMAINFRYWLEFFTTAWLSISLLYMS